MTDNTGRQGRRSPFLPPPKAPMVGEIDLILGLHDEWATSAGQAGHPARLFNLDLSGADFAGRNLSGVRFELCDLRRACFRGARLKAAWLHNCELDNADLADVIAPDAQFLSAYADGATFKGAMLDGACFLFARLNGADFSQARLKKADFESAEFRGANFRGADISGVQMGRWFLEQGQIADAVGDLKTRLPNGFTVRNAEGMLLVSNGREMVVM